MIKTAIVEDEQPAYQTLKEYLERFGKENNVEFSITHYSEGLSFLEECEGYDLVFMDIELPNLNGMDIATKLREKDTRVALIFVTNMVQYAIRGYSVDAIDYVLKPIQYNRFYSLMMKVSRVISLNQEKELVLKTSSGVKKVSLSALLYIQITDHLLIYKTDSEEYEVWGSLANAEKELPGEMFCRCNNSTIINLKQVTSFDKECVYLTKKKIAVTVSRSRRKGVLQLLNAQMGI
jgi:DNA-binding LytR/AlgR family response regulator